MHQFNRFALAASLIATTLPTIAYGQDQLPVLEVYTYDSFAAEWGPGPALKEGFEKTCSCVLSFTGTEDGIAMLRRVQLEGEASTADVVVGIDTATSGEARSTGLFAPHGLTLDHLSLPQPWTDRDFVPFDYGYFAYVYNREKLPDPPGSFEELIASPPGLKIVIQDPRSSTPGLGHVMWIAAAYGERAPEIWKGLAPHVLTMTRGWSEAYGLFLDGEADMVLSYTTSPAYHRLSENEQQYEFAPFDEGHLAQIETAAMLKSTDQPELARAFLEYLVSPEAQQIIPTTNWMYPVLDLGADLPAAFGPEPGKVLQIEESAILEKRREWVDAALAALQ